ncbi:superoxide dismutase [Cu-Zn]-like isoform X2 [Bradysia coprophila]|uniref:superoxide dismutase [Cu-Zn]-like isoform X2 n=1 Tax=Bradysia coprophila TaxID=38358 RepID=UPI00187DCE66|nr:superoxide dismutase [Cu-Zn]-like isoform X2 [Bradysia coprophila]
MKKLLLVCVAISVYVACAGAENNPIRAVAVLTGVHGITGTVHFTQTGCDQPVLVEVNIGGLNTTGQGFHIHETGDLSNGCTSLAAHYNPHNYNHAGREDDERHVGDLGNIFGNANGVSNKSFTDELISLSGPHSIIGRGVIVHLNIDDLGRTDHPDSLTTGNAGPRVACGVIGYVNSDDPFQCPHSSANILSAAALHFLLAMAFLFNKLH